MSDVNNNVIALMVLQQENKQLKEKLEKIKQIVKDYDGSTPSMIKQFSAIQEVLEDE